MRLKTQSIPAKNVKSLSKNPLTGYFIHLDYKMKSGKRRYTKTHTHLMPYFRRVSKISEHAKF